MVLGRLKANLDEYIQGKNPFLYIPAWLFAIFLFFNLLRFQLGEPSPTFVVTVMQSLNFFLHEMSHLFMSFAPNIITAMAGSGSELLLGLGLIIGAFLTRCYFASVFCFLWFMLSTQATADYMADARSQNMSLVSFGGGDPVHDWNFIFGKLGLLEQDQLIAGIVRGIGIVLAVAALLFTAYLMIRMAQARADKKHAERMDEIMKQTAQKRPENRPIDKNFISGGIYPTPIKGVGVVENKKSPDGSSHQG